MESKSSFGLSLLQNYSDNDEDSNCESSICQNGIAADHEVSGFCWMLNVQFKVLIFIFLHRTLQKSVNKLKVQTV